MDREGAAAEGLDALHELVAVRRRLGDEVQHEHGEEPAASQLAEERIGRPRPAGGRLGDGLRGPAVGRHREKVLSQ